MGQQLRNVARDDDFSVCRARRLMLSFWQNALRFSQEKWRVLQRQKVFVAPVEPNASARFGFFVE